MCLLIASPSGLAVDKERIDNAADNNPHGIGIAVADGLSVRIRRMMTTAQAARACRAAEQSGLPYVLHFRYATHGTADRSNCHPFRFGGNQFALAHNGIISGIRRQECESDTLGFTRFAAHAIERDGIRASIKWIEVYVGPSNKIALIDADGEIAIANESGGHWDGGIWYSNKSYELQTWDIGGLTDSKYLPLGTGQRREYLRSELGYDVETEKEWEAYRRAIRDEYTANSAYWGG